ncbi:hypothetical protein BCF55_0531 [Hydrogenivirga caldilitoris]|uniref:DUF8082 domain-containing protein n=1 Tax=Hydrogenivirga caldilitoris TaxID=246264 RepID=A0A497XMX1_9AQUI|nr:hypothetical protein [Hydrogenivirga caldilitoris]RLJ70265.1 hypothetical protein BCF55_0531 [Hydrogenivirga caldilitoris]
MVKRVLFKDLDINVMNINKVYEEVRKKEITGFLRVVYWSKDDYLLFNKGAPYKVVTFGADGSRSLSKAENFAIESKEGTASLVETTIDDLVGIIEYRHNIQQDGSLVFFPYGLLIQEPVSISFLDINKEFLLAQRSHLDGYVALYTEETLFGIVIFQGGFPVAVFGGDGSFGDRAVTYINANLIPAKSFMSMYTLEPELLSFAYSMHSDNVRKTERNFRTYEEAEKFVAEEKRNAVIVIEGEGIHRYDMFFRGQHIDRLVKEKGLFVNDEVERGRLATKVENLPDRSIWVYDISLIEKPQPIEVVIEGVEEEVVTSDSEVPLDKVMEVKSAFIKEIGPLGKLIWEKTLNEFGFKESSMTINHIKIVVDKLKREIPEDEAAREFLRRVESILPDII